MIWGKFKSNKSLYIFVMLAFVFAFILMTTTFGYNDGHLTINRKLWSDFLSHIPLIRSFSYGDNLPPEYPLFPGEKIRYHFLFYLIVGFLERLGMRIDIAVNLLSIFGMLGLLVSIYLLTIKITKSKVAGWLAALVVILNSSLSWIYYFGIKGLNFSSLTKIISNSEFSSFGPYDDNIISAFWNLNIYTNQRHLAFSFTLMFLCLYLINSKKWRVNLWGIFFIGVMAWLHKAMLLIIFGYLGIKLVTNLKNLKKYSLIIVLSILVVLPGILFLNAETATPGVSGISIKPGFIFENTSWHEFPTITNKCLKWILYWLLNMGILPFLAFAGWIKILKIREIKDIKIFWEKFMSDKSIFFILGGAVFIIANIFAFASDVATNHKLINFSTMMFGIYAAYFLVETFKGKIVYKVLSVFLCIFLFLGGLIDLPPIFNDTKSLIADVSINKTANWILNKTPKDSVFLATTYDNQDITIVGRKVYHGWPYFAWSIGYDTVGRENNIRKLMNADSKNELCEIVLKEEVDYLYVNIYENSFVDVDIPKELFLNSLVNSYEGEGVIIFDLNLSCN